MGWFYFIVSLIKDKLCSYKINNLDIDYFIKKVGNNINNVENELEKLINYKFNEKVITRVDIDDLCESNIYEEVF